eukprot:3826379-Pleurochrysis_carterae.AAC.1
MASFSALLNKRKDRPTHVIGTLHSDNAGEFLSYEGVRRLPRVTRRAQHNLPPPTSTSSTG